MTEALVTAILAVLVVISLGFATWAAVIGGLGVLTGARFERCPLCHHHGQGCP
jgi:hypothetical protein